MAISLSESMATGDWREWFLDRDRTYVLERCGLLWDALIH